MARLTQEQWRALIDEQATSGQTAVAFCAERGIDSNYFSTRKKQLSGASPTNSFVAVATTSTESQSIQLFAGAVHLRIPTHVSVAWLTDLIKALA